MLSNCGAGIIALNALCFKVRYLSLSILYKYLQYCTVGKLTILLHSIDKWILFGKELIKLRLISELT